MRRIKRIMTSLLSALSSFLTKMVLARDVPTNQWGKWGESLLGLVILVYSGSGGQLSVHPSSGHERSASVSTRHPLVDWPVMVIAGQLVLSCYKWWEGNVQRGNFKFPTAYHRHGLATKWAKYHLLKLTTGIYKTTVTTQVHFYY